MTESSLAASSLAPTFARRKSHGTSPGKENALRAFGDYWANLEYGTEQTPGTFSRYSYGDVEFFLLDTRYHRAPKSNDNDTGSILGPEQTTWLEEQLAASTATFKLLVSSTVWSQTTTFQNESWLDFPAARAALFDFLSAKDIQGVVLLAGDVRHSTLRRLHRSNDKAYALPEIVSSPLADTSAPCLEFPGFETEQIACVAGTSLFVLVDVDTTAPDPTLVARILDDAGTERATMTVKRSELQ